jgi:hypothetical protein
MSEHESDPGASIEHLDWQADAGEFTPPELSAEELLPLVNALMHRLDAGEPEEEILLEQGGWEALEQRLGSKYMKEIFGNREENAHG